MLYVKLPLTSLSYDLYCLGQPKSIKKLPGSKHSELKKIQEFSRTPPKIQGLFKTM